MATNNQINASNSWNFALIDFFHDLSLLKEGKDINFQKASTTLDGCVKIYSSRVDSAVAETGKLLSGLAVARKLNLDDIRTMANDEIESLDNVPKKKRKLRASPQSTLAKSFEELQVRKIDEELLIDPLFRKTLADFDEGGAASLLLSFLNIDLNCRMVFDSLSDDASEQKSETKLKESDDIDIMYLKERFFGDLSSMNELTVCPSLNDIENFISTNRKRSVTSENLVDSSLKSIRQEFEDSFYAGLIFFDDDEVSDNELHLESSNYNETLHKVFGHHSSFTKEQLVHRADHIPDLELMAYFDRNFNVNCYVGSDHWKIAYLKTKKKEPQQKKDKENIEVPFRKTSMLNFLDDNEELEDELFAESDTRIEIPKKYRCTKARYILPEDLLFNSKRLVSLFCKEASSLKTFNKRTISREPCSSFSKHNAVDKSSPDSVEENRRRIHNILREDLEDLSKSYDQSFYQNTWLNEISDLVDIDSFHDAPIVKGGEKGALELKFSQNILRTPTYLNFARITKNIDIRLLKTNIKDLIEGTKQNESPDDHITLTNIVKDIKQQYPLENTSLISTSLCFVCLLHLANEAQLSLENLKDNMEVIIRKRITQ